MIEFDDERPLTTDEARAYLKMEDEPFARLVSRGELPYTRIGRQNLFRKGDLVAWFNAQFQDDSDFEEESA